MPDINYTPPATIKQFILDEHEIKLVMGPVGCLAAKTLVVTEEGAIPIADIDRPMRVLSWNAATCRFQLSWCGGSFPKGRDYLYRVSTPQGEFDAAGSHLLLCADGEYRRVSELQIGDALATGSLSPLQTTEERVQNVSPEDALRLNRTDVGYLGGYARLARQYGQPLLQDEDNGQVFVPSLAYAHESSGCFSQGVGLRTGAQLERIPQRNPLALSCGHQQTQHCDAQSGNALAVSVSRVGEVLSELYEDSRRVWRQFLRSCGRMMQALKQRVRKLWTQRFSAQITPSGVSNRTILAIVRKEVKEAYWDLQVEGTQNYVTIDGAIHHNSAKSTGCIFTMVYEGLRQKPGADGIRRTRYAVVRNTNQQLMDTTFKSFNAFFRDGEAGQWKATEKTFVLRPAADTVIEVMFRPLDTEADIARLLSLEVSGIWFNEAREINEKVFTAALGRIGRYPSIMNGGCTRPIMLMDTNPPEEDSWLYKLIEENTPTNMGVYIQPPALIPGTYDVNPDAENLENLPKDYYQTQVAGAINNEEYINVYLRNMYGRTNAGKPVFPMFNPSIHVAHVPLKPNPLLPLVIGFDPGLNSGLTFGQYTLNGQLLVYDAIFTPDTGTERLIDSKIKPLLSTKYKGFEVLFAPDPAANIRSSNDEKTAVDKLKRAGFKCKFVDMNNQLLPRLEAVEYFLTRLTDSGPAVLLDPQGAKPLIKALGGGYRYAKTKDPDQERPTPDKNNVHSHIADSFQYLCRYFQHNAARTARYSETGRFVPPPFVNVYAVH